VKKTKLELTWPGKEDRPRLEPRILLEHPERGHHAGTRRDGDLFDNMLIKGDNLLALKALEQDYAGKVKCVFIDPPYNTGVAFEHYDDGLEHSLWLSLMRDRIEMIRTLLSDDGSLWLTIDENEGHYLKVLCDEVFGRSNFVRHITWQKKYSVSNNYKGIASICDIVLVYRKSDLFHNNLLPRSAEAADRYSNPDDDARGPWKAVDYLNQATVEQRRNLVYDIKNPFTGELVKNRVKAWKYDPETHRKHVEEGRLWWGLRGENSVPALKLFLSEVRDGMTPHNWWPHTEVGHTDEAKKESIGLFSARNVFGTPKPERLMQRIIALASNPGDLILDSFAGSGTTGAVAHKMGRRWIMVEIGDHADTHIVPRMTKVIDGDDQGGVTEAAGWEGGGGFRYYTLAPSLLERDAYDNWVIAPEYNGPMLAQAMCKHLGFTYDPAQGGNGDEGNAEWWRHGRSSERDFLYVTTQALTQDALRLLSEEVGPDRSLLICARAFSGNIDAFENLTCRKIPASILSKCEWGRDDYSLNIAALPEREATDDAPDAGPLFAREPANG
jgi:adenine-specific DNA-methyltransferase